MDLRFNPARGLRINPACPIRFDPPPPPSRETLRLLFTSQSVAFSACAAARGGSCSNHRFRMNAAPVIASPLDGQTSHDAGPLEAEPPAAALPLAWDEPIYIPEPAKRVPLRSLEPSLPTLLFLNHHDFWVAGDLHGRSYPGLRLKTGCDLGIMAELRHLVDALQRAHGISPADIREEWRQQWFERQHRSQKSVPWLERRPAARRTPAEMWPGQFTVPEKARSWDLLGLQISTRLQNILRRRGIRCLGELQDLPIAELRAQGNCGARSIAELQHFLLLAEAGGVAPASCCFVVPEKVRSWDILSLPLPTRLKNIIFRRGHPLPWRASRPAV